MIRRRQRDTFLFALLLMTRAAYVRSLSQYEIQAYEFGGAFDTPTPPPPLLLPKADAAEDSPPTTPSELGSDASLEIDSLAEVALPKDDEERTSATTKARSPAFKVSEQTSGVAGETMEEPILADDELLLYYKDLKKGGGSEAGAEVTAAGRPAPSPRHHGPTGDAFLPVVGGTINLERLQPAPSATAVSREQGAEPDVSDTGKSSGSKLGATNAAFNRSTAISLDYYYKPYYTSDSDPTSGTQNEEEEDEHDDDGYYYKQFMIATTSSPHQLHFEPSPTTISTTTTEATTTVVTPRSTLLQKILDGEFNFFNDPVANWIAFFTAAGIFFQFFATPFGQVTTGRRRRRKRRADETIFWDPDV